MMAAGNPNWWSMQHSNNIPMHSTASGGQAAAIGPPHPFLPLLHNQFNLHGRPSLSSSSSSSSSTSPSASSSLPFSPLIADQSVSQELPQTWSQLLLNGGASTNIEERLGSSVQYFEINHFINSSSPPPPSSLDQPKLTSNEAFAFTHHHHHQQQQQQSLIKDEVAINPRTSLFGHGHNMYNQPARPSTWSQISPKSCVTALNNNNDNNNNNNNNNNNFMDFSTNCFKGREKNRLEEHLSEQCNSPSATTSVAKKPRTQPSSTPPLKVRKEKLGDRITALHQIVSPFGKTDTASVLLEAIGYIRLLQNHVETLCSPYNLGSASTMNQPSAHGERNCLFPDHPGQLLNDSCMKRRGAANNKDGKPKDLKSRGLCLVPTSCTQVIATDNASDYWTPSLGPAGF